MAVGRATRVGGYWKPITFDSFCIVLRDSDWPTNYITARGVPWRGTRSNNNFDPLFFYSFCFSRTFFFQFRCFLCYSLKKTKNTAIVIFTIGVLFRQMNSHKTSIRYRHKVKRIRIRSRRDDCTILLTRNNNNIKNNDCINDSFIVL